MALNIATLKTRALTAVIFVVVMLAGLLWNSVSFLILLTVIHFGCWYELVKLMRKIYGQKYFLYSLFGLLYITIPIMMLIDLWFKPMVLKGDIPLILFGKIFPIAIIFSIWINDTMAYIVGSLIGKTPFSKISPKKTWEGTIGGAILCIVAVGFLFPIVMKGSLFLFPYSKIVWFSIAALCAIFGTAGDLFESKLKRMADVKDSGTIMPGHGGFLDRFDSLLFAAPAVWVYVKLFM